MDDYTNISDENVSFNEVMNMVLDGFIVIDEFGIIQNFNPASSRMFGYEPDEVIGQNVKILMPQPYRDEHNSYLDNYIKTGQAKIIGIGREVKARRKNGEIFYIQLAVNKMRLNDQLLFVGAIHDLSEQKAAEEVVKESREELKIKNEYLSLSEKVAGVGHWSYTIGDDKVYWSSEVYHIHGVKPEEYTPSLNNAIDFYHPEDRPLVYKYVQRAIDEKKPFEFRLRIVRPDGEIRHVLAKSRFMPINGKDSIFGIFQDVTEREELLKVQQETLLKLKEYERFQNLIKESNPDLIYVKDKKLRVVDANRAFLALCFKSIPTDSISAENRLKCDNPYANVFVKHDHIAFEEGASETIESIDIPGDKIRFFATKRIRFENAANESFILGIARDVTAQEELIAELRRSNSQLDDFAYISSHDLKEPLRGIHNYARFLKEDYGVLLDEDGNDKLGSVVIF
ncbi:MAG: PAS domain S-box protein [Rickettsiales bacterium]|nr:PAS domain S-box protein [Rickettsiales bacterium]